MDTAMSTMARWLGRSRVQGERVELERSNKMDIYMYVVRQAAAQHPARRVVKAKWVFANKYKGEQPEVPCRLVTQELGYDNVLAK